ncbi:chemotaxis-specific protein-glutamate methyltransferase CheB [bacterium]|nr:chemotaxis-specific protein-glutamate methyltransferase CheB [bacterium]
MANFDVSVVVAVKEVSKIVSDIAGIQLGEKQYSMVENRLKSRMSRLGLNTSDEYLAYLKKHEESETEALLSLMTTHHTYFFREFSHFEHILNNQLKNLIGEAEKRGDKKIRIWSAACSRGQEAYSLAMFFDFHLKLLAPHIDFEIWGTDIDPESVEIARNGVYKSDELNRSPAMYVGQHWVQGKNNVKDYSKVRNTIKNKCKFNTLNLLKIDELAAPGKFDLIFCRNVFIYFNQEQIQSITTKLVEKLAPHGCFVLGVSESLQGLKIPVESTGPSVYQLRNYLNKKIVQTAPHSAPEIQKPLQILCVDDSRTIHTLMKSILTAEQGFVIKDKAMNGEEALKLLQTQTYDAITLDLHMPVVDGLSFLSQRKDKTPVIIVSSINREDDSIAKQAIKLGALDYVEKPTVENLVNAGNEIRSKLKSVLKFNKELAPAVKVEAKKIRTLIVDDSETIRNLLNKVISADPAFEVVGLAHDAFEAERIIKQAAPDLITLDIHMPGKNGVQFLKEIQSRQFIPVVMISALSQEDGPYMMDALSSGAIDYIKKPDLKELSQLTPVILERLKTAAKAKKSSLKNFNRKVFTKTQIDNEHITLIGSSTGGTEAVRSILESMPPEIPPILIVQHIPAVFSKAFADRLNAALPFTVKEASHGEEVTPNKVLIAPGGMQMGVKRKGDKLYIQITEDPAMNRHRPSVDYLFKSVIDAKIEKMNAVVLTGMGADGSKEISKLKMAGAKTIAQDEATSVVYGMPKMAAATGAIDFILPLYSIAEKIIQLSETKEKKPLKKTG